MGLISHGGEVPALLVAVHSFTGLLDKEAIIYLDLMDHFIQAGQLPPHQRCEAADAVDARFEKTSKIRIFLRAFMPALAKATELDIRNVARLRSAQPAADCPTASPSLCRGILRPFQQTPSTAKISATAGSRPVLWPTASAKTEATTAVRNNQQEEAGEGSVEIMTLLS
jgi:hypothetical protein